MSTKLAPRFDHVCFPVSDFERAAEFYRRLLDAEVKHVDVAGPNDSRRDGKRIVNLFFGESGQKQRITLLPRAEENTLSPQPVSITLGAMDYCFYWPGPIETAREHLDRLGIPIEFYNERSQGGRGVGESVYFRDPDGNLLEFISYEKSA